MRTPKLDNQIWRTSSHSAGNGDCVEVGDVARSSSLAIRDSKDKAGPILLFAAHEWRAFVHGIKAAELPISLYGQLVRAPFTVRRRRGL